MAKKTKALMTFMARISHYGVDLELVDVFKRAVNHGTMRGDKWLFKHTAPDRHPKICARKNSDSGRILALQHLRRTLYSSFLKDIYEDVMIYMESILRSSMANGLEHKRLIGDHPVTFTADDLLSCTGYDEVIGLVSQQIFRRIEQKRDTMEILVQLDKKLGLGVDKVKRDAARPYLEIRHLLVHNDGKTDDAFVKAFPQIEKTSGKKLSLRYELVMEGRSAIEEMVRDYDAKAVAANICEASFIA